MKRILIFSLLSLLGSLSTASDVREQSATEACARCIEAHEDYLASDVLGGRGSATHDELVAAEYIASELQQYGIEPEWNRDLGTRVLLTNADWYAPIES